MNLFEKSLLKATVSMYCKWVCVFFLLGWGQSVFAQNKLSAKVNQAKALNPVSNYKVFSQPLAAARLASDTVFLEGASVYRFSLDAAELNRLSEEKKPYLEISLPLTLTQNIELELVPHTIFAPSFKVTDSKGQVLSPRNLGVFYQGIVKGDENSVVSISIINGEIAGIISQKTGNWNLGKEGNSSNYIFFNERDVKNKPIFNCTVQEPDVKAMGQNLIKSQASLPNVACGSVEIYIEADNALYQAQGSSSTKTVSYVNSLFSKVATLYTNEGLSVVISQIKVWDTADPYVGYNSTSSILSAFRTTLGTNFNGRLAHFLSGRGLGGGIAYLNVLCEKSYAHGVSGSLSSTIVDLPTYSWNVVVVTHEIGHNFGSPHTQSCSWPGGAIDNCYTTEGGCPPGPAPTNGGTIMSYCHLVPSIGINFSNGFGPLPGDLIRNYTQACLGSAVPPSNLTVSEIYATHALATWTHTSGIYTVEYKASSANTWISAGSNGNKNRFLTSLTANTTYDWRVNANCSGFSTGTFTTNSTPAPPIYCTPTFTDGCTYGILMTSVQLGGTTLSSSSGCSSGGYTYFTSPVKSLALGQSNSFIINLEGYYNAAQVAIWIDLNKNGTFETTEKLFTTSSGQTQAITGSVTIPVTTLLGSTRMRIIVNYSTPPTNPCGAYNYGEAEDYNVNIVCPTISQYTVTGGGSYCAGGIGLVIGLNGSQAGLNYQLKRDGSNVGSVVAGTGAAISFGNQTIAGTYTVEAVTPFNSCTSTNMTGSVNVTINPTPTLRSGEVSHLTTCGVTNGSIAFTTTNLPNGSYLLSYTGTGSPKTVTVASNTFVLNGLAAGTYGNFSITNNGCTGTDATSKTLNPPLIPTLLVGTATNPTTCGGSEGSVAFTTNLPDGNYWLSYTGAGSPKTITVTSNAFVLSGLTVGVYSNFSITNNNCTGTDATSKTLHPPLTPTLLVGTATNPTTCGGNEGSIAFTTTNLPNGSYWLSYTGAGSPKMVTVASNAFVLTGLPVGFYGNFSITNNGCSGTDATSKTLNPPLTPTLLAGTVTNPTTCGGNEGSIAFATTNLPDGSYSLSYTGTGSPKTVTVASNAFVLSGLPVGVYGNFSITNNGCVGINATSKILNPPLTPTLLAGTVTNPTTCGGNEGSIAFATNLPNGSYSLSYTGTGSPKTITVASNAFVLSGLGAGTYSNFSITNNGCTGTDATPKTLTPPATPTLAAGTATNPTTCGGSEGSISFTTTNLLNGSYSLTYTGTGSPKTITVASNAFVLSGLTAGTYSNFSITNNGCTGSDATSKTLTPPASPTLSAGVATNPTTCTGSNGSIGFTTSNLPNGNYVLSYTGTGSPKTITVASNGFTLAGLSAGVYSNFSITNNGCTGTDITSKTLTAPLAPTLIAGTATNPTTCGGTEGSISFSTNLPNGTYTLTYTGTGSPKTVTVASNSFILGGLAAGTYSDFSITNNGCTGFDASSKTLNPPVSPNAGTITGTLTICVGTTTTLASNGVSGGVWSSSIPSVASINPTTGIATGLVAGSTIVTYTVTANGCTSSTTATLTVAPSTIGGSVSGGTLVCAGSNTVNLNLTGHTGTVLNWQASLTADFASSINVVNTTTNLTVTNLSQTTYFRAIVKNGICNVANSSSAVITVNPLPVVNITGGTTIPVGGTTTLAPTTGGVWVSNNTAKATVTNAGLVTGVAAGTANFTFTQTSTGCSNTTNAVTVTGTNPCNQAITLVSPTDDYGSGTVTKQTNLSINASNKISGTGTTVTYQSGSSVTLGPGFKADSGTVFKTQIGGCN
jgi:trimeric autotransporter adhesin